jgi:hypothetical protein
MLFFRSPVSDFGFGHGLAEGARRKPHSERSARCSASWTAYASSGSIIQSASSTCWCSFSSRSNTASAVGGDGGRSPPCSSLGSVLVRAFAHTTSPASATTNPLARARHPGPSMEPIMSRCSAAQRVTGSLWPPMPVKFLDAGHGPPPGCNGHKGLTWAGQGGPARWGGASHRTHGCI